MAGARGRGFNVNYAFPPCHRGGGIAGAGVGGPTFLREPISQLDLQKLKKRRGDGPRMELRLLVRGRNAGIIIGKGGSNIRRIRQEYKVNLFLTDTQSPERVLSIMGDLGSICETILDLSTVIDNNPPSDVTDDVDVRILMHQSQTGVVVGRKGQGIRDLRTNCNARVRVYGPWCPRSTDRVVQINGEPVDIANCIATIVDLVATVPPVGLILPYNPNNFVEIKALEYGGFTGYDVTMPFQGETVLRGPDGSLLTPAITPKMEDDSDGSWFDGPSPIHDMQSPRSFGPGSPSFQPNNFSPSPYNSPGFRGGPGMGPRGQGPYGRGDMGRGGHMNQGPRAGGWGTPVQYPIGGRGHMGSMGQSPMGGYGGGGGVGAHAMGTVGDEGDHSPAVKEDSSNVDLHNRRCKVPLDQCPGLSFHPIDTRTVQVGIPKPLQTVVMGRRGTAIRDIRIESKAKIMIEVPPAGATERFLTLSGTPEQLQKAQYLLQMRYLDGKKRFTEDPEAFMNRGQRKRSHPDAPWMTDDIMKMKLMRRKLERNWRGAKTEETKKIFKDYCLEMNRVIRKVKEEYYLIHGGGPEKKSKPKLDADGNEIPADKDKEGNSSQEEDDDAGSGNSHLFDEDNLQDADKASSAAGDMPTESGDGLKVESSS